MLSCRTILVIMITTSYILQHTLRLNISIAVIEMVGNTSSNNCTNNDKNNILGSFYWGYSLTSFIAGRLSEIYGTRIVMGLAMVFASIFTLLTPVSSSSYQFLLLDRFLVGTCLGIAWASNVPLAIRWFAPTDRSKFMGCTMASQLGAALCFLFGGTLIDYFGWWWIFYTTGGVTLIWCLLWFWLVYDSPEEHPRAKKIEGEVNFVANVRHQKTPWCEIILSKPVWAILVANTCIMLNVHFGVLQIPSYMNQVLLFDIKENGLLSSVPYFGAYLVALVTSYLADDWQKKSYFSLFTVRRIFSSITFVFAFLASGILSIWGYNRSIAVASFIIWQSALASAVAGFISGVIDLTPSYSGSILGVANGFGGFAGYLSAVLVNQLIPNEDSFKEWRYIFWLMAVTNVFALVFYFMLGSSDLQKYDPKYKTEKLNLQPRHEIK